LIFEIDFFVIFVGIDLTLSPLILPMIKIRYLLIFCLILLVSVGADAQMKRREIKRNNKRMASFKGKKKGFPKENLYSMVGLTVNAMNYYGDLAPKPSFLSTNLQLTRPAVGMVFSHRFGPRYALTGTFMYGTLRGSDIESADKTDENAAFRYYRNLSFRNRIKELSAVASFDLWDNQYTYISRVKWTPYAFAGLAVFHHNPQARAPQYQVDGVTPLAEAGEWINLQKLGTEGQRSMLRETDQNFGAKPYKLIQFAIPFGVGARFRVNQLMDFSVEFGMRYLFTDYIDDVSKNYVDLSVFGDNELAKALSYRSNELSDVAGRLEPVASSVDGTVYNLLPGYGSEQYWNMRGNKKDKDTYMVTTFKLTYIFGKTFTRAKFR
jgi:hypothetical protein